MNTHKSTTFRHVSIVTTTLIAGILYGCGSSNGGETSSPQTDAGTHETLPAYDGGLGGDDTRSSDETTHGDAKGEACGSTDDPDDDGKDTNCDGVDGVVGKDIYVDVAVGSDSNSGTPDRPMQSIAAALSAAAASGGRVLVDKGEYTIDKNVLGQKGAFAVFGGYAASFVGAPKRALTTLHVDASGLLIDGADEAKLVHLSILSDSGTDKQLTAHALRSKAKHLVLDDVAVQAGDGATGSAGTPGDPGGNGATGISATLSGGGGWATMHCDTAADSANATGAADPFANPEGRPPANLSTMTPASNGSDGIDGTDGGDGARVPAVVGDLVSWSKGIDGKSDATAGYGGAGGADTWNPTTYYFYGGGGGGGGCGGKGGGGGAGGGGSIAIVVIAGTLDITRSTIQTGFAGSGGAGGVGGAGGSGGWGGTPWRADLSFPSADKCTATTDHSGYNCVPYGGRGGKGGTGGHGGGGAGGWSIGIVTSKAAIANVDSLTTFRLGKAGNGGASGAGGRAPDGESHNTFHID